jgi:MoxR-like ATPase
MSQGAESLSKVIAGVPDLSSPNGSKWDPVYPVVEELFGLTKDQTYLTFINKATNTQVRISKQMPTERPVKVAVGVCGKFGDWTSRSYAAQCSRAIQSRKTLNCIVLLWKDPKSSDSLWEGRLAFHRAGAPEAAVIKALWPDVQLVEVVAAPATHRDAIVDADFTRTVVQLLRSRKNVVLEGVPGTGKSFAINDIVERWESIAGRALAEPTIVVLHPSSSYEDLVEGLRPKSSTFNGDFTKYDEGSKGDTGFAAQLGRFAQAAAAAAADPDRDHLLVLDELNRANVPRAFGELLLVMESTKRAVHRDDAWSAPADGVVRLTYTGTRFWVPENLHVLATMNTTDRSVAPLDAALRRRFVFKRLEPLSEVQLRGSLDELDDEPQTLFDLVVDAWSALNDDLLRPVIGPDAVLGHSYLYELHRSLVAAPDGTAQETCEAFLRYTLLPQLIDSITTNGREAEIFDPSWARLDSAANAALALLDALLESFGMRVALEGEGLSRRLSVIGRPSEQTSGDDPEPEGEPS